MLANLELFQHALANVNNLHGKCDEIVRNFVGIDDT